MMGVPTYTDALVKVAQTTLAAAEDKLVRIDDIYGVDVDAFIAGIDGTREKRFGFISPYLQQSVSRRTGVSRDPRLITSWRNEPIANRRRSPILIFGTAEGREEAGLKKVPHVIRAPSILRVYREQLLAYVQANIRSTSPRAFCAALIDMCGESLLDTKEVTEFFDRVLQNDKAAVTDLQKELWRLRLIPDPRAIDDGSPGARLTRNYQAVELLRNQPDTAIQVRQVDRLVAASDEGDEQAAAALRFRKTGSKADLKLIELDKLLKIVEGGGSKPVPKAASLSLVDALDVGIVQESTFCQFEDSWKPDADNYVKEILVADKAIRIVWRADRKVYRLVGEGGVQILATQRRSGASLETAERVIAEDLVQAAKNVDVVKGGDEYEGLTKNLVNSRGKLAVLVPWHENLLQVLIVCASMRTVANDYWAAWEALTDRINKEEERAAVSSLTRYLSMLDGHWILDTDGPGPQQPRTVQLYCIHPYILRPLLELAQYALVQLGEENLGTRLLWAYDKVLPAYPAIWRDGDVLIHAHGAETPTYSVRAASALPTLSTAQGLLEIVKSFVGLHPFSTKHLSILLIDPPAGPGIGKALDKCLGMEVADMTVFIAHTDRRETKLPLTRANVEYLGNIKDAESWARKTGVSVHLAVAFRRAHDAGADSHTGAAAPSRGLHNSLTASITPPDRPSDTSWVPRVFLQPRDSNDVVRGLMLLARQSDSADRLYRISPMLPESEAADLEVIARVCDWLVIGTPGPIGLVPPRTFPKGTLFYIGREDCGPYGLFVYTRDLFSIRKQFESLLQEAPMAASADQVEAEVRQLALKLPNGILRIGRGDGQVLTHIGLMAASYFASQVQ